MRPASSWAHVACGGMVASIVLMSSDMAGAAEPPGAHAVGSHCARPNRPDLRLTHPLPTVVALVPGAVVHGAGHWALGEDEMALRLLVLEGVGFGAGVVSLSTLFLTGASRYFIAPASLLAVGGAGLLTTTFLADVYGTLAPDCGFGRSPARVPSIEAELGYRAIYDPQFAYRSLAVYGATVRYDRLRIAPSGTTALDTANERLRLEVGVRGRGSLPGKAARNGTYVDATTAVTQHEYTSEGFGTTTVEIAVESRLDLQAIGETLRGSFAEGAAGVAVASTRYDGVDATDENFLLLARFAFGVYLGPGRGEASVYYDHRHDGYVAGAIVPGLGSGIAGHIGMLGHYYVTDAFGVGVEGRAGSALLGGLSMRYRHR